jgi:hypothetical protein
MKATRVLLSGIAAISMAVSAAPAMAKAKPGAARKLALVGAQGASDCVTRPGEDGSWRKDEQGNWLRCKAAGGKIGWEYIVGGAVLAAGVVVAIAARGPSSP